MGNNLPSNTPDTGGVSDLRARLRARGSSPVLPSSTPAQAPNPSPALDDQPNETRRAHEAGQSDYPALAVERASLTRFSRASVDPNAKPSWMAWGLPDLDDPDTFSSYGQPVDGAPQWRTSSCLRCARTQDQAPHLLLHSEGRFFCMHCGWHGNARNIPARHMDSWLDAFRHFIDTTSLPLDQAPANFPGPAIPPGQASILWGIVWNEKSSSWDKGWWLACYDAPGNLRAAWQALAVSSVSVENPQESSNSAPQDSHDSELDRAYSTSLSWLRPRPMPACPMGTFWAFRSSEEQEDLDQAGGVSKGRTIYIATRPDDYLALVASGLDRVVCLPPDIDIALPNATPWQFAEIWDKQENLIEDDVLVFALSDADRALEEELGRRLSRDRCSRVRYSSPSDLPLGEQEEEEDAIPTYPSAFAVYKDMGPDVLVKMVSLASPFPVKGVHELDDMDDAFEDLYKHGLQPGRSTGHPSIDPLYTVVPGQWTLVTGIPGHGKSTWLDGVMINLARRDGWRFGVFTPENQPPTRYFAGLMEKLLDKPFSEGPTPRITHSEKNSAKRWLNDRFKIILPDEDGGEWTLDAVLALARILVRRYGIQGLVIDPWNEMDHSQAGDKEVSYLSQALTKIRRFARLHGVHVWIVAHPTKMHKDADGMYPVPTPYDVAGGAHWRNKADNVIAVYRFVGMADQGIADIHIQKIRFKEVGKVGLGHLRTNPITGSWIDDVDYDRRGYNLEKGIREPFENQILPRPRTFAPLDSIPATSDLL